MPASLAEIPPHPTAVAAALSLADSLIPRWTDRSAVNHRGHPFLHAFDHQVGLLLSELAVGNQFL